MIKELKKFKFECEHCVDNIYKKPNDSVFEAMSIEQAVALAQQAGWIYVYEDGDKVFCSGVCHKEYKENEF